MSAAPSAAPAAGSGGSAGGAGGGGGGGARAGGAAGARTAGPEWSRLSTSEKRLVIDFEAPKVEGERLDPAEALAAIRGNDVRPLLLLRDCIHAEKDARKLEGYLADERVVLATKWFRCVRVDKDVVKPTHPLHSLFGAKAPHVVLIGSAGTERVEHPLMPTASALWGTMIPLLKKTYANAVDDAVTKWRALLGRFDALDVKRAKLAGEAHRTASESKRDALRAQIDAIDEEKSGLHAEERRLSELAFRDPEAAKAWAESRKRKGDESWRDDLLRARKPESAPAK